LLVLLAACAVVCVAALARSSRERRRLAEDLAALQTDKALAEERLAQIRQRLGDLEQDLAEAQERTAGLASENRDLVQNGASLQSQVAILQMDKAQLKASLDQEAERGRAEAGRWASELASLREENARLAQQMAGVEELRARDAEDRAKALALLEARLGDVGRQMLAERAEDLRKRSEETLTLAVAPLAQQLDGFRSLVARTAQHSSEQAGRLAEQRAGLQTAHASLSRQAEDLVRALARGGKAQGLWGERQLEKVLDASGLEAGRDYVREADAQDGEGKKLRPDCVVRLPQGRHLVVDAKCSLTAYAEACAAESEDARREAMARHVKSVRAHVKELATKRYG
ncbi:MAG: DNA recombination protein RmuC, partial [Desulfovibrio sp.]|nr:DNA recombination protein RmuC [Desulfovibrio sp.]